MLRNQKSGELTEESTVLSEYPNTSFPSMKTETLWNDLGYDIVFEGTTPSFDALKQALAKDGLEQKTEGSKKVWYTKYKVVDRYSDIEGGKTKAQQEADAQANLDVGTAASNRERRNTKLRETDWWAGSDLTMTDAQKLYRKALRDLPAHSSWPNLADSDWPTKP